MAIPEVAEHLAIGAGCLAFVAFRSTRAQPVISKRPVPPT